MSAPENAASGIAGLEISIARHRRDVSSVNGVLLAATAAERLRLHELLRRAGHLFHSTGDHEDALDLVADTRPALFVVVVDDIGEVITTLKRIKLLKADSAHVIRVIAVGNYDYAGAVDISMAPIPREIELLQAVESLFRKPVESMPVRPDPETMSEELDSPSHLMGLAENLGVEFVEEFMASTFDDIDQQLQVLEGEKFRKNIETIKATLHSIRGLALNVDGDDIATYCSTWHSESAGVLLDSLPTIIHSIRSKLPGAKASARLVISDVSQQHGFY
ncbi:MAG: hypothetical protein ACREXR_03480 [Gammaproteobacteria bacterium]